MYLAGALCCMENILGGIEISSDILIIILGIFPEYIQASIHENIFDTQIKMVLHPIY